MSAPEGMEFNKPYPMPKSWLDPEDEEYDESEGLEEMLEKQKEVEEEKIENLEIYKDKDKNYWEEQLSKGTLTRIQVGELRNKGLL